MGGEFRGKVIIRSKKRIKKQKKRQRSILGLTLVTLILIVVLTIDNFSQKNIVTASSNLTELQRLFTVCIDPGHGGYDVGAKSISGIYEKEITLKVALNLGKSLENQGVRVIYTRTSDKVPWPANNKEDIKERVRISNENKADVFISIHCNIYKSDKIKGLETWCRTTNSEGENLAKVINTELKNLNYTDIRGIKYEKEKSLGVLRTNNATSVLVEIGYITNKADNKFLTSSLGQVKCGEALGKAILQYKNDIEEES